MQPKSKIVGSAALWDSDPHSWCVYQRHCHYAISSSFRQPVLWGSNPTSLSGTLPGPTGQIPTSCFLSFRLQPVRPTSTRSLVLAECKRYKDWDNPRERGETIVGTTKPAYTIPRSPRLPGLLPGKAVGAKWGNETLPQSSRLTSGHVWGHGKVCQNPSVLWHCDKESVFLGHPMWRDGFCCSFPGHPATTTASSIPKWRRGELNACPENPIVPGIYMLVHDWSAPVLFMNEHPASFTLSHLG